MLFFLGKPVNGKVPPAAAATPATAVAGSRGLWSARVPVPADRLGPTDLSVQVVNNAQPNKLAEGLAAQDLAPGDQEKYDGGTHEVLWLYHHCGGIANKNAPVTRCGR